MKWKNGRVQPFLLFAVLLAALTGAIAEAQQYSLAGENFVSGVTEALSNEYGVTGVLAEPIVVIAYSNDYGINPLLVIEEQTGEDPSEDMPQVYFLANNYPNPFNPVTTITYGIDRRSRVTLSIYDVAGRLVRTLVDEVQEPGRRYTVTWDGRNSFGRNVSSGIYFCRMRTADRASTRKMVLLR